MKYIISFLLFVSSVTYASCPELYPSNVPRVTGTELCNSFYVVVYDERNNRPIFASERLTNTDAKIKRINAFRPDSRLKHSPTNADYTNTGYDRGHLVPAADANTDKEMYDTFLLSNMTPQAPMLNRKAWKDLEEKIRLDLQKNTGYTYVLTIPVYGIPKFIGRLPVPSGYWKVVYLKEKTSYYFADNKDYANVQKFDNVDVSKILSAK